MSCVRRVLNVILVVATVGVIAAAVYVVRQSNVVPGAGTVPSSSFTQSAAPSSAATSTRATAATTSASGAKAARRTAFIGDDYTAGAGASSSTRSWASVLTGQFGLVGKRFSVSGGGYAKPGDRGGTYASLVPGVVAFKPDLVIVSGGRNDAGDDRQTLQDRTRQLFAELRAKLPKAKLVAIKPWWGDSPHPADLATVDDAVRAGVTAAKGTYLAIADPLFGHANWMADGANPNDAGYRQIAASVATELRKRKLVQ